MNGGLTWIAALVAISLIAYLWYRSTSRRSSGDSRIAALGAIAFDTTGWTLEGSGDSERVWSTPEGDRLTLKRIASASVPSGRDLDAMRADARTFARRQKGGIVRADFCQLDGVRATALIYKREERPAYVYTGMLIIPADQPEFLITIVAGEHDETGVRDALVSSLLFEQGKLDPSQTDARRRLVGWFRDPYDRARDGEAVNSVADDEQYDALVPAHPLTKVRRTLRDIEDSIRFQG